MQTAKKLFESIPLTEASRIFRDLFENHEYWIAVFNPGSQPLIEAIERKYYPGARDEDFLIMAALWEGKIFGLMAARKRMMLAHQFQSLIRQVAKMNLSEREVLSKDCLIVMRPSHWEPATALLESILQRAGRGERGERSQKFTLYPV
jgi:hypothetical protein